MRKRASSRLSPSWWLNYLEAEDFLAARPCPFPPGAPWPTGPVTAAQLPLGGAKQRMEGNRSSLERRLRVLQVRSSP